MTGSDLTYARLQQPYSSGPTDEITDLIHPARTSAQLASASDSINLVDKFKGKCVFDTTLGEPVWASGAAAGDAWIRAGGTFSATTTELEDAADPINTVGKYAGKIVYNSTSGILVYASGTGDTDDWNGVHDNLGDHTPS